MQHPLRSRPPLHHGLQPLPFRTRHAPQLPAHLSPRRTLAPHAPPHPLLSRPPTRDRRTPAVFLILLAASILLGTAFIVLARRRPLAAASPATAPAKNKDRHAPPVLVFPTSLKGQILNFQFVSPPVLSVPVRVCPWLGRPSVLSVSSVVKKYSSLAFPPISCYIKSNRCPALKSRMKREGGSMPPRTRRCIGNLASGHCDSANPFPTAMHKSREGRPPNCLSQKTCLSLLSVLAKWDPGRQPLLNSPRLRLLRSPFPMHVFPPVALASPFLHRPPPERLIRAATVRERPFCVLLQRLAVP